MSEEREFDEVTGTPTTGHVWDGIRELDTPLPRWWLYIFYATILAAAVYWVLMPSWPLLNGYTQGVLGFSDRRNVVRDLEGLQGLRAPGYERLLSASYADVIADPQLASFARAAGETAFGDNCRTCHGAGGAGAPGYPNLADDVWLWGGTLEDIQQTIQVGIRAQHPDTRLSLMPAYGRDRLLTSREIADVTEHVLSISAARTRERPDMAAAARGAAIYEAQCIACHGARGEGSRANGAPSLIDDVWLHGGTRAEVRRQIELGRNGVMPSWQGRFDPATIRALAVYVYGLGGGEASAPPAPTTPEAPAAAASPDAP